MVTSWLRVRGRAAQHRRRLEQRAVAFLLTEQPSWITGQTLDVDGGETVVRQ